jgi:hypothetical protein
MLSGVTLTLRIASPRVPNLVAELPQAIETGANCRRYFLHSMQVGDDIEQDVQLVAI